MEANGWFPSLGSHISNTSYKEKSDGGEWLLMD